jgi:hypothetical protein
MRLHLIPGLLALALVSASAQVHWTPRTSPATEETLHHVAFGQGKFLFTGDFAQSTANGVNWTTGYMVNGVGGDRL